MGDLEDYLPEEAGKYKYLVFCIKDEYFLRANKMNKAHIAIADVFFKEIGQQVALLQIGFGFRELGGLGGGILEWDPKKRHLIYHIDCMFGPLEEDEEGIGKLREGINRIMEGSSITYDAPLDKIVEERGPSLIDPITRMPRIIY